MVVSRHLNGEFVVADPIGNTVRIGLQDTFGVAYGSSALWLVDGSDQGTGVSTVLSPDYKVVRWFMPLQNASDLTFTKCVKRPTKAGVSGAGLTCAFQAFGRRPALVCNQSVELLAHRPAIDRNRGEQMLLIREVAVGRSTGYSGSGAYRTQCHGVGATVVEQTRRRRRPTHGGSPQRSPLC